MHNDRAYDARPHYPPVGGHVTFGWDAPVRTLPEGPLVLAVDGPEMLPWIEVVSHIQAALRRAGREVEAQDTHDWLRSWAEINARTASPTLADDPHFATLTDAVMAEFFEIPPSRREVPDVFLVHGPGAALVRPDVLWYADLPKRDAEAAVAAGRGRNLGLPKDVGMATTRRLYYIDWPILDRHRDAIAPHIDRWVDAQDPTAPESLDGASLRASLAEISEHPFRVQPTFRTVSWGGHWAQRTLGASVGERNSGLGYELIGPENGVLIGDGGEHLLEVPFQLLVALAPQSVLGPGVHAAFGTSFPIRFDYLDTVDGGDLSVHCHPQAQHMRRTFGFPYAQHEAYYVMVNSEGSRIMLGLTEGADLRRFEQQANEAKDHGREFDIFEYVQAHPATRHQLFAVPAGTPHGSGTGNVVLEVSATPYLYSLRIYDWLRRNDEGDLRPVHVRHAFAALQQDHVGTAVSDDLIQKPRVIRTGSGWREELLYSLPEVFYEVRRFVLEGHAELPDDTAATFHVLNLVDGSGLEIELESGYVHDLAYAETIIIPAAAGPYRVRGTTSGPTQVVKALVS